MGGGRDWGSFGGDGGGWGRGGSTDRFGRGQGGGPRWGQQDKRWELRGEVGLVAEVRVTAGPLATGAAEHEPWACRRIPGAELVLDAAPDRQGHGHISCRRETRVGPWWGEGGGTASTKLRGNTRSRTYKAGDGRALHPFTPPGVSIWAPL